MRAMPQDELDILKKEYVELCCRPRIEMVRIISDTIAQLEDRINNYQRTLIHSIREKAFKEEELERMKIAPSTIEKEKEFEKLISNPDIENIEVREEDIFVWTTQIDITFDCKVYDIGKFLIQLSSSVKRGYVILFKNLTNRFGDYYHPHITADGRPCLGNIQECLPNMIGAHQYAAAISVAIQYLKSYSDDGNGKPYVKIHNWPVRSARIKF